MKFVIIGMFLQATQVSDRSFLPNRTLGGEYLLGQLITM